MRPKQLRGTWREFLALWDAVAAPPPFGIELDEESAPRVLMLWRRLQRAGVPFSPEFNGDMQALAQSAEQVANEDEGIDERGEDGDGGRGWLTGNEVVDALAPFVPASYQR